MQNKKGLLVYNPHSGKKLGKKITQEILDKYSENFHFEVLGDKGEDETRKRIAGKISHCDFVVAIGGDGLVNLVLQDLNGTNKPLFVYPAGTGNDFYRHHFPRKFSITKLPVSINLNNSKDIDLVKTSINSKSRIFGQVLSVGFDSFVNARANQIRYMPGTLKYVLALFLELRSFKPLRYEIEIDGQKRALDAMMVVVANGPTYGGGMKVLPNAMANDGLLDVLILNPVSKVELLRVFPKVFLGKHISHSAVEIFRCKNIRITSQAPIYADGELFGSGDLKVEILPKAVKILDLS